MIYTIGHYANYMKAISQNGEIEKTGRRLPGEDPHHFPDGYPGGYAFQSAEDAERCIHENHPQSDFAIFGLNAEWERDTEPARDGWWHNLLVDSVIVVLPTTAPIHLDQSQ